MLPAIKSLIQILKGKTFKGKEWQLLHYFQDNNLAEHSTGYVQLLKKIDKGHIPQESRNSMKNADWRAFKRLFQRLGRLVLLINPDKIKSPYVRQIFLGHQEFMAGKFLRHLYHPNLAKTFFKSAFKRANKHELQELRAGSAEYLAVLASLEGDIRLFNHYREHCQDAQQKLMAEREVFLRYQYLVAYFSVQSHYSDAIKDFLEGAIETASHYHETNGTPIIFLYLTRLRSFYHELALDFKAVVNLWEAFDHYLQAYPGFSTPDLKGESHVKKMGACLNLRDFKSAERFAHQAFKDLSQESLNWFYFNFYHLMLLFHSRQFERGHETLQMVFQNARFQKLPDNVKELFLLVNGFMEFVIESRWDPGLPINFRMTGNLSGSTS